jgi:hypothetical protein
MRHFLLLACWLLLVNCRAQGVRAPDVKDVTGARSTKESGMKTAQDYIDTFERGEYAYFAPEGLISDGKPDAAAVELFGQKLEKARADVSAKIVELLANLGRQTDPLRARGADVLRHPKIVELLARTASRRRSDAGREAAMDRLRTFSTTSDLLPFHEGFTQALASEPTDEAFLLVAKIKSADAKDVVERLATSAAWKTNQTARIARAALGVGGGAEIETKELERLAAAEAAGNGDQFAETIHTLGMVGTRRSLAAVALRLRTPLTIAMPNAERTGRIDVLDALRYNYPDHPELYSNNMLEQNSYAAPEVFCSKTFGTVYSGPRPPIVDRRGLPSPTY